MGVGNAVGAFVGAFVGFSVGALVGSFVGGFVGEGVGCLVGACVGQSLPEMRNIIFFFIFGSAGHLFVPYIPSPTAAINRINNRLVIALC